MPWGSMKENSIPSGLSTPQEIGKSFLPIFLRFLLIDAGWVNNGHISLAFNINSNFGGLGPPGLPNEP